MRFIFLLVLFISFTYAQNGFPLEYYNMKATKTKQVTFFDYLYPKIALSNKKILKERAFIISLKNSKTLEKESLSFIRLTKISKKYSVKNIYNYQKLLKKVDIIPPSMALAQAAVESGWGMSRFVKEGNNLFGHWTYGKVGIIPLRRDKNAKHLIRIFNSLEDSISAYMLNLNRTRAYYQFRNKREEFRKSNINPKGLVLSKTMINYSAIKLKYIRILRRMIKSNNLVSYDKKFYKKLKKDLDEI